MNHFDAIGAIVPEFSFGDWVRATTIDPEEGTLFCDGIVTGLVWDSDHWDYALMFPGYPGSDFGWTASELSPLPKFSREGVLV